MREGGTTQLTSIILDVQLALESYVEDRNGIEKCSLKDIPSQENIITDQPPRNMPQLAESGLVNDVCSNRTETTSPSPKLSILPLLATPGHSSSWHSPYGKSLPVPKSCHEVPVVISTTCQERTYSSNCNMAHLYFSVQMSYVKVHAVAVMVSGSI